MVIKSLRGVSRYLFKSHWEDISKPCKPLSYQVGFLYHPIDRLDWPVPGLHRALQVQTYLFSWFWHRSLNLFSCVPWFCSGIGRVQTQWYRVACNVATLLHLCAPVVVHSSRQYNSCINVQGAYRLKRRQAITDFSRPEMWTSLAIVQDWRRYYSFMQH